MKRTRSGRTSVVPTTLASNTKTYRSSLPVAVHIKVILWEIGTNLYWGLSTELEGTIVEDLSVDTEAVIKYEKYLKLQKVVMKVKTLR